MLRITGMSPANLRLVAAVLLAALLAFAGCSASVDPSPHVNDPARLTVLPPDATMFPNFPTTFVISGGTGSYLVASNNQSVLGVAGNISGKSITLVPNPVLTDTAVTLTFRDTGTAPLVNVPVVVKPGLLNNDLTVTPNPLQSSTCNPGVCSGGDAQVSVTLSQGGSPLAFRTVDFSVVTGDYRFITPAAGVTPERLELTARIVTDQSGKAIVRIRVTPLAPNQSALLQVTDVATGGYQRAAFVIAQFTGNTPAFFTVPSSITFFGPFIGQCPQSGSATVTIHGGSPPYTVQNSSSAFFLQAPGSLPSTSGAITVFNSGGYFTVSAASQACVTDSPVSITDATGRTITMLLTNKEGTSPAPPAPFAVVPTALTIGASGGSVGFIATNGLGTYFAASPDSRLDVTVAGSTVTVKRNDPDPAPTA